MATKKLRVGIIGTGGIANNAHIPGYKAIADQVEIVACADILPEAVEETAKRHGIPAAYHSYDEMLAKEELDAVSVCTPNKAHAPAVVAALNAGCHVICEKPPAITVDQARSMDEAAHRSGKVLTFGFMWRFSPEVRAAKRFSTGGGFGDIYTGRVTAVRRRGIPSWGVFTNKELQGGGPLIDIGVHMLDSTLYIMGYPEPAAVTGVTHVKLGNKEPGPAPWGAWNYKDYSVEDVCNALIRFENGAALLLETSFIAHIEPMEELNIRLSGTKGGMRLLPFAVFRDDHGTIVNEHPAWLPGGGSATGSTGSTGNTYTQEIRHFVRCVRGEAEPVSLPSEAVKLQRIIQGIYQSAESGRTVEV